MPIEQNSQDTGLTPVFEKIPAKLKEKSQWKLCYKRGTVDPKGNKIETDKRPVGGPTIDFNTLSWPDIEIERPQYFGFCLSQEDNLVGIDVDDLPEDFTPEDIPIPINQLLTAFPTYVEVSPSGRGLHIWYESDKSFLKHRKAADQGTDFDGAVYLRDQFLTVTGNHYTPLSTTTQVATIDASLLEKLIMKPSKVTRLPMQQPPPKNSHAVPTVPMLRATLSLIPPTLSRSPVQEKIRAIYRTFRPPIDEISDYEHWRLIICAVHHAAAYLGDIETGIALIDEWSSSDPTKYPGSEEVRQKFLDNPPKYDGSDITFQTLLAIKKAVVINWPYKITRQNGDIINQPVLTNLHNWKALIDHYGLVLSLNEVTKEYKIAGNNYVISQFFDGDKVYTTREQIEHAVLNFAQGTHMPTATISQAKPFVSWWSDNSADVYNPIKRWIETAAEYDPDSEPDYFDQLWSLITTSTRFDEQNRLFKSYLKKNLMGLIRAHFYVGRHGATTGIVIFSGPENTHKSTFVNMLLPQEFRHYVVPSQLQTERGAAMKELQLEAGTCQIWLKDEVENVMKTPDGIFKNIFVQNTDAYRPLYSTTPVNVPRKCIFFGTTNESELPITDKGSRRIQIIPISYIDTYAMENLDILNVYRQMLYEFNQTPVKDQPKLWQLTATEITETNTINSEERMASREIDIALKETYDFGAPFDIQNFLTPAGSIMWKHEQVKTLRNILTDIQNTTNKSAHFTQLKRAVGRLMGIWTESQQKTFKVGAVTISEGKCISYKTNGTHARSAYLTPPIITQFQAEDDEEVDLR